MENQMGGRPIKMITRGAPANDGEAIWFEMQYEDGKTDALVCRYMHLGRLITTLRNLATRAAQNRGKASSKAGDTVKAENPFVVKDLGVGIEDTNWTVTQRVVTVDGLQLDLQMSQEATSQLTAMLRIALEKIPEPHRKKPH